MKSKLFLFMLWLSCIGIWIFWLIKRNSTSVVPITITKQGIASECDSMVSQKNIEEDVGSPEPLSSDSFINVNTATLTELIALPGVGNAIAQDIIDYRLKNGPFKQFEDLRNVRGVGASKLEKIKNRVSF